MTSRERVLAALNHQTPDRCPIDLGSNGQTGMNVSTVYRLRAALGLDQHRLKVIEPLQMLGEIEEDLLKAVHSDFVGLWNRGNMMGERQEKSIHEALHFSDPGVAVDDLCSGRHG